MKKEQVLYQSILPHELKRFTICLSSSFDYAMLVMNVCRYILNNSAKITKDKTSTNREYIKIIFRRTIRCFIYISQDKFISFVFPFRYSTDLFWFKDYKIDSCEVSEVIRLLNMLKDDKSLSLLDLYLDNGNNEESFNDNTFKIIDGLLRTEAGYVRHDYDIQNGNGQIHPIHHFDVNFSSDATFKIGSYKMFTRENFETIFDNKSSCFYLDSYKPAVTYSKKSKKKKHTRHRS